MGDGSVISAVADAGPLIHLSEIGALSLLQLFTDLYVPDTVWQEATVSGRVSPDELQALRNVRKPNPLLREVNQFVRMHALTHLHLGECESLYTCAHTGVTLILTDDMAVRKAAKALNLTPVGSLGVIVKAYRLKMIPVEVAERHILDLQDVSSLFVTRAIVELALELL